MYLSPGLVASAADAMGLNCDRVEIPPQLHLRDPRIEHIGWAVKSELESADPIGRLYGESLGLALAAQIVARHARRTTDRLSARISQRRLVRVLDYIHEHLANDLSLSELAHVAGLSPSHFKVVFKQSLGVPVHQYVIKTRVEYATSLILENGLPLSQIAFQAGFASQSHMARSLKRVAGVLPARASELARGYALPMRRSYFRKMTK